MLLSTDLQVLCHQLSTTPVVELPCLLPNIAEKILCCKDIIRGGDSRFEISGSSVLLHKLRTQLTTLLNGKQSEGRLAAVVLIKAYLDTGCHEISKVSGSWARGLIAIIGKQEPFVTKQLCIITLSKLYLILFPSQTLVREISNPTLPAYVTSCINLLSSRTSSETVPIPFSLQEAVFRSFNMLIPRHAGIFKPFSSQISSIIRRYIVPSLIDVPLIPSSLKQSVRYLFISLLETSPKGSYSDNWGKAIGDLVRNIHLTADQVFRAVLEDWESSVGYIFQHVDASKESQGGDTSGYLTPWSGIEAGADKIVGLLEFLTAFLELETAEPITVPIGNILDLLDRIFSILISPDSTSVSGECSVRFNPDIAKDERDALRCRMPSIYCALLHLIIAIAERIEGNFMPLASDILEKIVCVFAYGKQHDLFRQATFDLTARILLISGKGLQKDQVDKISGVIKSCCEELYCDNTSPNKLDDNGTREILNLGINKNRDSIKSGPKILRIPTQSNIERNHVTESAFRLLPHFLSDLPQQYLDISIRSRIDRVAILSKNKEAMLASVLNPFIGACDKELTSILPHLTQSFTSDDVIEILLRPRMPRISLMPNSFSSDNSNEDQPLPKEIGLELECSSLPLGNSNPATPLISTPPKELVSNQHTDRSIQIENFEIEESKESLPTASAIDILADDIVVKNNTLTHTTDQNDSSMAMLDMTSDDESVHFTMELDSDSNSSESH